MKILYCNLATEKIEEKPLEDPLLGGRLLTSKLVSEMVPPQADPLGKENILVFATGPLSGRNASTSSRLSVGTKSPLTKGVKESNAGGMAGDSLAALGYRALVFTDVRPGAPVLFILDENGSRFVDATPYLGMWNSELAETLKNDIGEDYVCICNGPAGENLYKASGIAVSSDPR